METQQLSKAEIHQQIHNIELLAQASLGDEVRDTRTERKAVIFAMLDLGCYRIAYFDDDSIDVINPMDFSHWELVHE